MRRTETFPPCCVFLVAVLVFSHAGAAERSPAPTVQAVAQVAVSGKRTATLSAERASKLLGPADFANVGVLGAGTPEVNEDSADSFYLVYAGKSGATGGIEFDVFLSNDPQSVFENAVAEQRDPVDRAREVAADAALLSTGLDNGRGGKWAAITVRKGQLVFAISIPDSPKAASQLVELAKLVLARSSG